MGSRHTTYTIVLAWCKRHKALRAMLLAFVLATALFTRAIAQINNASDWHVPPPLPPGNTTQGTTSSKPATFVLNLSDIPGVVLPGAGAVRVPALAPLSTTQPAVTTPEQPGTSLTVTGAGEIPLPGAPDAPPLPKQTMQDVPVATTVDLPIVPEPEMPPLPSEPKPSGQTAATGQRGVVPLLPDIASTSPPRMPVNKEPVILPTPIIIENETLKTTPGGKRN